MRLNSIIFHTQNIKSVRDFYENKLGFKVGTYFKDGVETSDQSESYVNYDLFGTLLCFELGKNETDLGTIVLHVENFEGLKDRLKDQIVKSTPHFFKVKDPDGRTLIIESVS